MSRPAAAWLTSCWPKAKPEEARAEFERRWRAVRPVPRPMPIWLRVLLWQGDVTGARLHCEAALAIAPKFVPARLELAKALAAAGQTGEAARHYQQVLELNPNNAAGSPRPRRAAIAHCASRGAAARRMGSFPRSVGSAGSRSCRRSHRIPQAIENRYYLSPASDPCRLRPPPPTCKEPALPPTERSRARFGPSAACLLVAIALVYGQTLGHGFLNFDDNGFVFNNPHVTPGLNAQADLVGTDRWADTASGIPRPCFRTCSIASSSAWLPWGHHLSSVLLHAAASIGTVSRLAANDRPALAERAWSPRCSPCIRSTSNRWPGSPSGATCSAGCFSCSRWVPIWVMSATTARWGAICWWRPCFRWP